MATADLSRLQLNMSSALSLHLANRVAAADVPDYVHFNVHGDVLGNVHEDIYVRIGSMIDAATFYVAQVPLGVDDLEGSKLGTVSHLYFNDHFRWFVELQNGGCSKPNEKGWELFIEKTLTLG